MLKPAAALVAALCFALPAMAQRTLSTQGGVAQPGDLSKFQGNGQFTSAGDTQGDRNGKGVNPFAVWDRKGPGVCFLTDPSGNPHNAFCFGHDADGNPLITIDSLGGMAAKTLKCRINGVLGDCNFGGGSSGSGGSAGIAVTLHTGAPITLHSGATLTFHGN